MLLTLISRRMTLIRIAVSPLHQPGGVAEGVEGDVAEGQVHVVAEGGGEGEALIQSLLLQPLPSFPVQHLQGSVNDLMFLSRGSEVIKTEWFLLEVLL